MRGSVYDREPLSIEDAVEYAEKKERYLARHPNKSVRFAHENYSPSRSPSPSSSTSETAAALKELVQKVGNLESKLSILERAQRKSSKRNNLDNVQCYWCLGYGHYQNKCQAKQNGEPKATRENRKSLNYKNQD